MNAKRLLWFPLLLLFALTLAPTTGATEESVYAILYADRTLVFQYGNVPESGRNALETYPINLNGYRQSYEIPWYDKRNAIKAVEFADSIQPLSMAYWFIGFSSLESIQGLDKVDTSRLTSVQGLFSDCSKFTEMDLRGLDTSAVTNMVCMFADCDRLTSLNLSGWDISHVTSMSYMFSGCSALTELNMSGWDTSHVQYFDSMFLNCSALKALDVGAWDTSSATVVGQTFSGCKALATLDVSAWNTSCVTYMDSMFANCAALKALDVSAWDTFCVTHMAHMFFGCETLTALDLSGWDTSNVMYMGEMFANCSHLKTIYVSESFVDNDAVVPKFRGCASLVGGAGTSYDDSIYDWAYASDAIYSRIDNPPDAPGYFTLKEPNRPPVTLTLTLRDSSGEAVSMDDLRESVEIKPEVTIADAELKTADIFLVIYDSTGMMVSLQSWEVDLSKPLSFIRTTPIPQGVDASYVKFIMLSSSLTPLVAAQALE